LFKLEHS